jgi:soluble cytochrome b562
MKTAIALFILALTCGPAYALSVQDFNAEPEAQQSNYVAGFIEKMTADIATTNPVTAQKIRDYFAVKQPGKPFSEGLERLYIELGAVDMQAKQGRVDLAKVQLESMIVWVVKQKFPPQQARD